jgi:hypothetical protein
MSEYLYHYTSANGLLGMLENREIWATDRKLLNDRWEGNFLESKIAHMFHHAKHHGFDGYSPDVLAKAEHHLGHGRGAYVFSLSTHGDSYTQFRMYCPPEGGYVVGFRREYLAKIGALLPVSYDGEDHHRWCKAYARRLLDHVAMNVDSSAPSDSASREIALLIDERNEEGYVRKAPEYFAEGEVRLVFSGSLAVHLRASRSGSLIIPFVKIPLPAEPTQVRIAAGPGTSQALAGIGLGGLGRRLMQLDSPISLAFYNPGDSGYRTIP